MPDYNQKDIQEVFASYNRLRAAIHANPRFGFDFDWDTFCKVLSMLSIRARGSRLQNRITEQNQYQSIPANLNRGDIKTLDGKYVELKCSIVTAANDVATIRGIRPWQKLDAHLIVIIDFRNEDKPETYCFWLNKTEIEEECRTLKAGAVSGTKVANRANTNILLGFNLNVDKEDAHFKRWLKRYLRKNILL
ncbi:hypothetical protein COCOR_04584 [Corallococcus coralloides DSM 2259]|uniref:Restriction endonuclease n=1 Tax=Corallococcus coralloides (strain ATCC 25202 / DSM 2259 / NBRC 100086 / M2) TaxID=1144275 RepID=H8MI03_CORCM|nr:hypothetical protein [Corallococcus coralloides]AFE05907.1 hypothetical protein COCOR_04584 [Corallococcus coralloides DSM 2259]